MEDITVSDLEIMSEAKNYRAWMYKHLSPFIGQRVLEVGGGIGNLTEYLCSKEFVASIDIHADCVEYMKNKFNACQNVKVFQADVSNPQILELAQYDFDTIICINVLEHVKDDLAAIQNMYKLLRKGGRLVLLVPAFNFLYGTIDESLEHCRRYNKKMLNKLFSQTEFKNVNSFYVNFIGVFGWFLNNRILRRREESKKQILSFDRKILPITSKIEEVIAFPFGLSLISVWKK